MTASTMASGVASAFARRGSLLLVTMVIAVTTLFAAPATPAFACSIDDPLSCAPGAVQNQVDCLQPPTPAMPDTGATSFFVSKPTTTTSPDATADSRYTLYGYAGLQYRTYDLGCGPDGATAPDALINTSVANMLLGVAAFLVGLTNAVRQYAYDPQSMWGWSDDLVTNASTALYDRVFSVLGLVVVVIVGAWLMWSARTGDLSNAAVTAGWAILVMVVTTVVAAWPLNSATFADRTLTSSLGVVNSALHPNTSDQCGSRQCVDERAPEIKASGVTTDLVLYRQWVAGMLGSSDSKTAKELGPKLYAASAMTWQEAEASRESKEYRESTVKRKQDDWKQAAAQVKEEDPDAYEYLTGKQGSARIGSAFTALIAAIAVVPFDLMASLLIIVAFLIIRLAVVFLPAIAVVGIFRPASAPLRGLFRTVVAAIINCVIFGVGASVYLLAVELITTTKSLAGWQQILLIWLTGLVMWLALRPFRRLTSLTNKNPFAELSGGLGKMHRKVFGDMKQLAIQGTGTFLGDVAALEADDRKHAKLADSRPESWSRDQPRYLRTQDPPPRGEPVAAGSQTAGQSGGAPPADSSSPADRGTSRAGGYRGAGAHDGSGPLTVAPSNLPTEADGDRLEIYRTPRSQPSIRPEAARDSGRIGQLAANVGSAAHVVRDLAAATNSKSDNRAT